MLQRLRLHAKWNLIRLFSEHQLTSTQVLFPLFMNSRQSHLSLLSSTNLPYTHWLRHRNCSIISTRWVLKYAIPRSWLCLHLKTSPVELYPFTRSWNEIKHDPVHITQTFGTTGGLFNHLTTSQDYQNQFNTPTTYSQSNPTEVPPFFLIKYRS